MTEKQVRDIVRSVIRTQMSDTITKAEAKKIAKEEAEKAVKKATKDMIDKKEAKNMWRKSMLAYQKFMWEKKGIWMNQI